MSMVGELMFFLGLQIKQLKEGIFVNQVKHVSELLKKYKMDNAIHASTPMASSTKVHHQDLNGKHINEKTYRGMIGSLLHLTTSRPDIIFSVCLCAQFQSSPKESHLTTIKRNLDTWQVQKILDFGIHKGEISFMLAILMQIMQVTR